MPPTPAQAAKEQLTDHRLEALEDATKDARQVQRDTDHLKIELTHLSETVSEFKSEARTDLGEFKAEVRERDTHTRESLARLHQRFDEFATVEAREDGARLARRQMWKAIPVAASASAAVTGTLIALAALVLKIT